MDCSDSLAAGCVSIVIFLIINSILFCFCSAIQNLNEGEVEKKALENDKRSQGLQKLINRPSDLILTVQFLSLGLGMISGLYLLQAIPKVLYAPLWELMGNMENLFPYLLNIVSILAGLLCLSFMIALSIFAPKKIGVHNPELFAYRLFPVVRLLLYIFLPVSFFIRSVASPILRIFGIDPLHEQDDVTEDELIELVDEAHEQGVIEESEAEMIQNIISFHDKSAKDIMIHRTNMNVIDEGLTLEEAVQYMNEHSNSRYPVYRDDINNITGFVHIKDAMEHLLKTQEQQSPLAQINNLIRTVAFTPETRGIDAIFKSMQTRKIHMAIVVDEYGQTAGLLTMEDILEEIVGNILDEYDESADFIQPQFDESILMEGLTKLDDVEEVLGIDLGEREYETLNGYLTSLLGHIPTNEDKEIEANGYCFQILHVENNVIQKLRVEKIL